MSAGATNPASLPYQASLELTAILRSEQFRHSQRSSHFLRYVVEQALAGEGEGLKERTVGIAVFGKPEDYDTAADACVRVRANDVRRRLGQYYNSHAPAHGVRIDLNAGSYLPRFALQERSEEVAPAPSPSTAPEPVERPAPVLPPPMPLWQVAAPTVIAIFLAILAVRFAAESNDEYSRFWSHLLAHRSAIRVLLGEPDATGRLPQDLANSALPFSEIARDWQVPILFATDDQTPAKQEFEILLRILPGQEHASIDVKMSSQPNLRITAPSVESIQSVVHHLCSRQFFSSKTSGRAPPK